MQDYIDGLLRKAYRLNGKAAAIIHRLASDEISHSNDCIDKAIFKAKFYLDESSEYLASADVLMNLTHTGGRDVKRE